MSEKIKSANTIRINIQDMMVGKSPIPHHIELGYPNPMKDQLVDVRAIDVPVEIILGTGKSVSFQPGSESANIECITYSCILLNDLMEIDDLSSLLPEKPDTVRIGVDEWMNKLSSDTFPENWFIQHRNNMMLRVHIEVSWGKETEPLTIAAGTEWGSLIDQVQRRSQVIELAQSDEVRQLHLSKKPLKDYAGVQSRPAALEGDDDPTVKVDRNISNFMKDATGIFNGRD